MGELLHDKIFTVYTTMGGSKLATVNLQLDFEEEAQSTVILAPKSKVQALFEKLKVLETVAAIAPYENDRNKFYAYREDLATLAEEINELWSNLFKEEG